METNRAAAFVEENLKTIFAYSLSRVSNKEDAEDLASDIVLAILQSAHKLKDENAFYGYVWGIAANTYRKFMRRRSRNACKEIDETLADPSDFTEALENREEELALRREIAMLSKEHRECTVAYYYDELSCEEVSGKLNIPLPMVKYYLFKTRKILKEGISMEREFGEKSFKPTPFEFRTIYSGDANDEYGNLFRRKLPGQILDAAYYTPMSLRELVIELGVASVYLEDEVALLEKYGFIEKTPTGKYRTRLVIFTEDYVTEFSRTARKFAIPAMGGILVKMKEALPALRELNASCKGLSDERLLWATLWPVIRHGYNEYCSKKEELNERQELYRGGTGVAYGVLPANVEPQFTCSSFAGRMSCGGKYGASAADFGVLPEQNRFDRKSFFASVETMFSGEIPPCYMVLTEAEDEKMLTILSDALNAMAELYGQIFACASRLMHVHAPESVADQIDRIVHQTLLFHTVGLLGGCAVASGALPLPTTPGPIAVYAILFEE